MKKTQIAEDYRTKIAQIAKALQRSKILHNAQKITKILKITQNCKRLQRLNKLPTITKKIKLFTKMAAYP